MKHINLLATPVYLDRDICKECKHFRTTHDYRQIVDSFCCKCYSSKVHIVSRFCKKEQGNDIGTRGTDISEEEIKNERY